MEIPRSLTIIISFLLISLFIRPAYSSGHHDFLACLSSHSVSQSLITDVVYTPDNSSYLSILESNIRNPRFASSSTPKPVAIVTPEHESQIQHVVRCSRENGLQIRTRSGGHDYEGLSYTSQLPFVVIDLINLTEITIDVEERTAWVQTGATIGELFYEIGQKSRTLAFPAGLCPTVGLGGHISGGGYGTLMRKYGLAADHVVDARLVDANGQMLDRDSMGDELFWAIRGGGGSSFGVITAWKLRLLPVPETLTVFSVNRTLEQHASKLFYKWQTVGSEVPEDLMISLVIKKMNVKDKRILQMKFDALFLGGVDELLQLMKEKFPELGVKKEDCTEVSWIQSALFFSDYLPEQSPSILQSRTLRAKLRYFKAKSDYVQEPIPEHVLEVLWKFFDEEEADMAELLIAPYGGKMGEISESSIPFPFRKGYLYKFLYVVYWNKVGKESTERHINWMTRLFDYLTPYVSKSPRAAYLNNRDLDIGVNNIGNTSYEQANEWGSKYFNNNFNRLAQVKTMVDPSNFFRDEQSIPLLYSE